MKPQPPSGNKISETRRKQAQRRRRLAGQRNGYASRDMVRKEIEREEREEKRLNNLESKLTKLQREQKLMEQQTNSVDSGRVSQNKEPDAVNYLPPQQLGWQQGGAHYNTMYDAAPVISIVSPLKSNGTALGVVPSPQQQPWFQPANNNSVLPPLVRYDNMGFGDSHSFEIDWNMHASPRN